MADKNNSICGIVHKSLGSIKLLCTVNNLQRTVLNLLSGVKKDLLVYLFIAAELRHRVTSVEAVTRDSLPGCKCGGMLVLKSGFMFASIHDTPHESVCELGGSQLQYVLGKDMKTGVFLEPFEQTEVAGRLDRVTRESRRDRVKEEMYWVYFLTCQCWKTVTNI